MKNSDHTNGSLSNPGGRRRLAAAWRWLIEPSASVVQPERRLQARLLMAMLLILIILGLLSLPLTISEGFAEPGGPTAETSRFIWITVIGILLLAFEYGLSRTAHFPWAAMLLVFTLLGTTFLFALDNPQDLQDLYFLILGGLISGLFLSARTTAIIFLVTLLGILSLPLFVAGFSTSEDIDALFYIMTVGVLVVMATTLRQRYLDQIDWQTQRLVESESSLRELSIRDPLTGLFNRRYLEEMLSLEMIRAERKRFSIGIIMADIDHFKQINDTHGHAAGDAVLVQIANFFRSHVRSSDVTCRYGGEEFILFLPEASLEITRLRAEKMREDASHLRIQYEGKTLKAVTLSLGIAIFPEHGGTYDAILGAADAALYRAKNGGRNQVAMAN